MVFKGILRGFSREWKNNTPIVEMSLINGNMADLEALQGCELSVEIKKWHKKRSLDANAYLWVLCSALAEVLETSKEEVYEEMLRRYGVFYKDANGYITITVKSSVDMSKIGGHWKFYKGNETFSSYLMIKGSSLYDSREMAQFLDKVIDEAKYCGIETLPPSEIERMKMAWESRKKED